MVRLRERVRKRWKDDVIVELKIWKRKIGEGKYLTEWMKKHS